MSAHQKNVIIIFIVLLVQIAGVYQTDIENDTSFHKHGKGLPPPVIYHVKAVFDDLSTDNLLRKCLHGKTQNQNEAFNGTIWNRIPKTRFVKFKVFELAVFDAVSHFNIGKLDIIQ